MRYLTPTFLKSLLFVLFISTGCSNSYVDEIDRGTSYSYQPGYPELRVSATGQINESDTPTIIVSGDIVYGSLVYSKKNNVFEARVFVEMVILKKTTGQIPVKKAEFEKTIDNPNKSIVNSQEVYHFEEIFEVSPGDYEIHVIITDQVSGKSMARRIETTLPDPNDDLSHITDIRILSRGSSEGYNQATTYDIPSSFDSLKFNFQVTNNTPDKPVEVKSQLLKFTADTTAARPMSFNSYSPSSLPYIGIDYNDYEEIQTSTRTITQKGSVLIEFIFTDLEQGNYRLEVISVKEDEEERYKARDFSIKSPHYPSLKTPMELAEPLYYIMDEKEFEDLMANTDPQKLKRAIDKFWLSNIQNSSKARNVISLFYQRVEEANKQFSNFKEGWKTDPGMIYILFGPPWYSDSFSDKMSWSYSYNQSDPEKNFLFTLPKLKSKHYPFHNYLLERSAFYYSVQYRQVQRWRTGNILTYNL